MNPIDIRQFALLALPFVLIPSAAFVFSTLAKRLGKEQGYLLGFLFYWTIWCLIVPLVYLGKDGFLSLFVDETPLLSGPNWLAAVLWALIILVALAMYGKDFIRAPLTLILVAIPAATINGLCEELLWRGLSVRAFPDNIWLAIIFPPSGSRSGTWLPNKSFQMEANFPLCFPPFSWDWLMALSPTKPAPQNGQRFHTASMVSSL